MRFTILVLMLVASTSWAQTKPVECSVDKETQATLLQLAIANKQLVEKNADLQRKLDDMTARTQQLNAENDKLISKLSSQNPPVVTQLASSASADELNREAARALRVRTALALTNSFKVAPIQVPFYGLPLNQAPVGNKQLNCTSSVAGQTVFTNCQ